MPSIAILIVEDEAILAMDLTRRLTNFGYTVVAAVDNGPQALSVVQEVPVDLVLFDINIAGEWDGIETARRLQRLQPTPFIFLTALIDGPTIERARQVAPSAYITKPFTDLNLRIAIDLAIHNFTLNRSAPPTGPANPVANEALLKHETLLLVKDHFFIKQNYRFVKFRLDDVVYLQSDGNYTDIVTQDGKYALREVMSKVVEKMQSPAIVRIHRSFAINTRHIDSFSEGEVNLGKYTLPIGRSYRDEFMKGFEFR